MKKLTPLFLLIFFLASCTKEDVIKEEIKPKPLNVSSIIFSLNNILQKNQTSSYVSLRYWKDELLNVEDDISLVVNGVNAKLIKQTKHETFIGSNILFEIPALNITGEVKATYTIKAGDKVYAGEKILRYVDDYNIATVWGNLEKDYVLKNPHRTLIEKNGSFQISGATVTPEPISLGLGYYGNVRSTAAIFINPSLIAGLNGVYIARYDGNRTLTTIEISLGDENADPNFNKSATLADIENVYGTPIIRLGKKIYSSGTFDIEVNHESPKPTVVVKKVR